MAKATKKRSETVNSITGTNCVTVYRVLKESGVKFSQADITKIGQAVVKKLGKINRPKERQQEARGKYGNYTVKQWEQLLSLGHNKHS